MSENELKRMTIFELLGKKFVIPSYQRGYRWKKAQVTALLDHIWEFSNKEKEKEKENEFYCLQPIVVKEISDGWEVIDGQQRLTTISIILRYFMKEHLKKQSLEEDYINDIFSIEYETRPKSKEFLEDISLNESTHNNIDFYHMHDAYHIVSKWIKEKLKTRTYTEKFLMTLLGENTDNKSVQVIWYKVVGSAELSYDLFTRLNIGKISLTNAELIKALFLKKWGSETKSIEDKYFNIHQIKIASEWDMIEKTLQNDAFWYFISNSTSYITRIEYIFDFIMENTNHEKDRDPRYTFNEFYKVVNSENAVDAKWKEIKGIFSQFETWYHDRELYHLIGFMIATNITSIDKILKEQLDKTKIDFKDWLKDTIKKNIPNEITGLKYKERDVSKVLLLFNIVTIIQNDKSSMKFPFDLYKNEEWDIEHIHSQVTKEKFSQDEIKEWLKMFEDFFISDSGKSRQANDSNKENTLDESKTYISTSIQKFCQIKEDNKEINDEEFKNLFNEIEKYLEMAKFDEENTNRLGNLALLDSGTNRSYKNVWFPFKRARILKEDSQGTFIPIATKNVFMKAYSSSLTNTLKWEESDMDSYEDEIANTLSSYLYGDKNGK